MCIQRIGKEKQLICSHWLVVDRKWTLYMVAWCMLGDHYLTPCNYYKNRLVWRDVEYHKRFECIFLITNLFWGGMTQITVWQMISKPRSWVRVKGMSLWGRDYWRDHNLTPYNYSKNKSAWRNVECHKRFECVFYITNWFWGGMTQLTVRQCTYDL